MLGFSRYAYIKGSSYLQFPNRFTSNKAVLNVLKFNDNYCFTWAVLSKFDKGFKPNILNSRYRKLESKFNFNCVSFPTPLKEINVSENFFAGVPIFS